jgi:hypothetical protein
MQKPTQTTCRWCGSPITTPNREQRFCCSSHRYRWHQARRISPADLEERVRAIVRDLLKRMTAGGIAVPDGLPSSRAA